MSKHKITWGKIDLFSLIVILIPIIMIIILYNKLPDQMAVHFNTSGEADGFQGKTAFLLTNALLLIGLPLLLKVTRYIDPKKKNYAKFESTYDWFRFIFTLFLSGLTIGTLFYNLGYAIDIQMIVLLGIGILFIFLGNYMGRIRFNYMMGIKTPWTLANEDVWKRTHRLAGPLWLAAGVIMIILAFLPGQIAFIILMSMMALIVIVPVIYSYILYRRIE